MRVVVCRNIGSVEDLEVEDWPTPEPGEDQLVVDVAAAGVNFVDALFVRGEYQIKPNPPFVPGSEIAGTVSSVGDGVTDVRVGDRVLATVGLGGFAEKVVARPEQAVPIPDALEMDAAAAFTQSYSTALFSLANRAGLVAGEWVLVLGAGGGVGTAAIDVAKALGARVIAAASSEDRLDRARLAGADATVDYSTEDLKDRARELSGGGVDVVFDPVGGQNAEPALRALGNDGRFLVIGFAAGEIPRIPLNQVLLRNRHVVGVDWGAWMLTNPSGQRELMDELMTMVSDGRLHPVAPTRYRLDHASEALGELLGHKLVGKAVLVP